MPAQRLTVDRAARMHRAGQHQRPGPHLDRAIADQHRAGGARDREQPFPPDGAAPRADQRKRQNAACRLQHGGGQAQRDGGQPAAAGDVLDGSAEGAEQQGPALYRFKNVATRSDLRVSASRYAARWYSLITPPRTFRRCTGATAISS
jgi:hypothetical protein